MTSILDLPVDILTAIFTRCTLCDQIDAGIALLCVSKEMTHLVLSTGLNFIACHVDYINRVCCEYTIVNRYIIANNQYVARATKRIGSRDYLTYIAHYRADNDFAAEHDFAAVNNVETVIVEYSWEYEGFDRDIEVIVHHRALSNDIVSNDSVSNDIYYTSAIGFGSTQRELFIYADGSVDGVVMTSAQILWCRKFFNAIKINDIAAVCDNHTSAQWSITDAIHAMVICDNRIFAD